MGGFAKQAPAAVGCFEEDFEACVTHLQLDLTRFRGQVIP